MGEPSGARLKFFGAPFFQKRCDLALDLTWAAAKKKPAPVADAPVRAIATGAAGEAGSLPSQSPNGASSPKGGAKSRLPLWGRCPPKEGGEGTPLARGPAFGKPPSWHSAVRERRGKAPVSLAFFPALRAYKGKAVGLCPTTRNPLKRVDLNFHLASLGLP